MKKVDFPRTREQLEATLLEHREIVGDCWIWTGGVGRGGRNGAVRGRMVVGRRKVKGSRPASVIDYVPRVAYSIWNGEVKLRNQGRGVVSTSETCGHPLCFNPEHLRLRGADHWGNVEPEVAAEVIRLYIEERWAAAAVGGHLNLHPAHQRVKAILEANGHRLRSMSESARHPLTPWERILGSIEIEGDCWIARATVSSRSEGNIVARRLAFQHFLGEIPMHWHVSTSCGNKQCISPDHLFTRTPGGLRKLHPASVLEIRERFDAGETAIDLAAEFGVSSGAVYLIVAGTIWKCAAVMAAQPAVAAMAPV